ncbi:SoxR reducing system RseC family protein [Thermochromatium tepidum]|uniref:Fis family transcriptional regulator n=1 Tax=Thermochromatium tepidum ATCC 43061 TaxID=316276 RepID=A0A6I6E4R8_THETI|nr:SoxR reducing system RseC family protein [Thermochromatium tepidum]QGU31653.1 Fis family transcriptional regulator [Thermochromatium tepidum ATCC 43061]
MIEEQGRVIALIGDQARITSERRSACGHCGANLVCGTSLLDQFLAHRPVELLVRNPIGARIGDKVVVGFAEQELLRLAVAAYLAPILALIIGAMLGGTFHEVASLLGALVGLALAFWWLRVYSRKLARRPERQPVILRRLGKQPSTEVEGFIVRRSKHG